MSSTDLRRGRPITRPFHTCRRPTQSTIGAFCWHQSPGSAYQQTVDCWQPNFSGPQTWNDLPEDVTSAESLAAFRHLLKTHLFRKSFPDYLLDSNWLSPVDLAVVLLLRPLKKCLIDWLKLTMHVSCSRYSENIILTYLLFCHKSSCTGPQASATLIPLPGLSRVINYSMMQFKKIEHALCDKFLQFSNVLPIQSAGLVQALSP